MQAMAVKGSSTPGDSARGELDQLVQREAQVLERRTLAADGEQVAAHFELRRSRRLDQQQGTAAMDEVAGDREHGEHDVPLGRDRQQRVLVDRLHITRSGRRHR